MPTIAQSVRLPNRSAINGRVARWRGVASRPGRNARFQTSNGGHHRLVASATISDVGIFVGIHRMPHHACPTISIGYVVNAVPHMGIEPPAPRAEGLPEGATSPERRARRPGQMAASAVVRVSHRWVTPEKINGASVFPFCRRGFCTWSRPWLDRWACFGEDCGSNWRVFHGEDDD